VLRGEDGGDFLMEVGAGASEEAYGGEGNDYFFIGDRLTHGLSILDGGNGDDVFLYGNASDIFIGGAGQNYMWTGGGADIIRNDLSGPGFDVVYDWQDGADRIQLTGGDTYSGLVSAGRIGYDAANNNTFILDPGYAGGIILIGINVATIGAADFTV
jgi:Ca2+-binding RTX toxin-like protein